ncbi:hypothetical protein C0995_015401 [Termitomyces sp. Mi166|nr:hypothetical protein C0995_015401 [Termitomyces sp. Mi166\
MLDPFQTSGPTTFGTAGSGGRNYDYTKIYGPDRQGEEIKENARVWNVYLDEAENYDADMIQGFRNIIDGLLVFASLFSAVVTTFVVQTSQVLQPDTAQIMVSLLFENNQLLRAAGNRTALSAIPTASLGPGSRTYASIDAWVNGLFFTSLALSLSTALLTVLAKQWIQAYTAIVPGDARTRALIRHFRFQGLTKWKLGDIIEILPLILHASVAIFLVGLALYVSQLSYPICGVVSAITALTFLFYFGTSVIPAFDIACPYRIPFMFTLAQPLSFAFSVAEYAFLYLWCTLTEQPCWVPRPHLSRKSLKMTEHSDAFKDTTDYYPLSVDDLLACDSLGWILNLSSNQSVKEVVVEGACSLLDEWSLKITEGWSSPIADGRPITGLASSAEHNNLIVSAVEYSLSKLPDISSTSTTEDDIKKSTYGRLIGNLMTICSSESLLDGRITHSKGWQEKIEIALIDAYKMAIKRKHHVLSRCLLDWGYPKLLQSEEILLICSTDGDAEDIDNLVDRGMDLNHRRARFGWTALHWAAVSGNLDAVVALVEREPGLVSVQANNPFPFSKKHTTLELAIHSGNSDVVAYLLAHDPNPPSNALHAAAVVDRIDLDERLELVELLLDHGWDRTLTDTDGMTAIDLARSRGEDFNAVVEYLEHYQTVRLPPYPTALLTTNEEET